MTKILKLSIVFVLVFLLQGCTTVPPNSRPTYYDKTKWGAQELNMYFEVDDKFIPMTYTNTYGEIIQGEVTTPIFVLFDYSRGITFMRYTESDHIELSDETVLFKGTYKFEGDEFVMDVWENDFLDPSIHQITFIREDLAD